MMHLHWHLMESIHHLIGELTMSMVYGLMAVTSAAVAVSGTPMTSVPVVQYGALGLCGFMVYFLCKHITDLHKDHSAEREKLTDATLQISNKAIESYSDLTAELQSQTAELRKRTCFVEKYGMVEKLERLNELEKNKC